MRDDPSGAALLDAARRALTDEVLPGLEGRPRYVALMVANAIGIVAREVAQADALARVDATLDASARAIRAGAHDADADLHAALTAANDLAARIWKPSSSGP